MGQLHRLGPVPQDATRRGVRTAARRLPCGRREAMMGIWDVLFFTGLGSWAALMFWVIWQRHSVEQRYVSRTAPHGEGRPKLMTLLPIKDWSPQTPHMVPQRFVTFMGYFAAPCHVLDPAI